MKLTLLGLFTALFFVSCVSCSLPQKHEQIRSPQVLRLENCEAAINKHHEKSIHKKVGECLLGAAPWVCPLKNKECIEDMVGFCKTRVRRLLQFQILQCLQAEDVSTFLNALPQDWIITPDGKLI